MKRTTLMTITIMIVLSIGTVAKGQRQRSVWTYPRPIYHDRYDPTARKIAKIGKGVSTDQRRTLRVWTYPRPIYYARYSPPYRHNSTARKIADVSRVISNVANIVSIISGDRGYRRYSRYPQW